MSGVVTVLSLANGASTEVAADQVAIVGQKDLNERTGQPDPIILPVAHATVPSPVSAPSDQNNGPWAKARVADPAWMTKLIAEGKATPTWVVKSVAQTSEDPSGGFPPNLPAIGTILDPGMRIATDEKQQVKLTNGLDVMTIRPNSAVVLGNVAADAPEADFRAHSRRHRHQGRRSPGQPAADNRSAAFHRNHARRRLRGQHVERRVRRVR